jgi:hypothetical protein
MKIVYRESYCKYCGNYADSWALNGAGRKRTVCDRCHLERKSGRGKEYKKTLNLSSLN